MTPPACISRHARFITFSILAFACLGLGGCASQSEKEFVAQYGYGRADYFGTYRNKNHVPCDVKRHN